MQQLGDPTYLFLWILSNAVALFLLTLAWRNVKRARWAYAILFAWAAWLNASTAWNDPISFLKFADLTFVDSYRDFLLHDFAPHIQRYMAAVAVCQLLIALGLLVGGWPRTLAAIGGMVFFVLVAPLGIGAAFPCTLILAFGLFIILRKHRRSKRVVITSSGDR